VPEDSFNSLEKTHLASLRNNTRHSFGDKVAAVKRRSESQIVRHYPDRAGKRGTEERNMVAALQRVPANHAYASETGELVPPRLDAQDPHPHLHHKDIPIVFKSRIISPLPSLSVSLL